uniref:Uncharacterized protein n=1 Tax=viral metagenome TaxID=1070528 RepID=A0A6C0DK73_9ZZZZ
MIEAMNNNVMVIVIINKNKKNKVLRNDFIN